MRRNVLCLLACILCLPAWAEQTPELNEVVVTATRIDSPLLESPSAISIISSDEIAASGAHDLSAVIEGQSGVVINDYGPVGATKTVSLRGSTSDQVLVLLDGVRVNSGRISSVDLSTIPMEIIDRVEILRGGASTIYGSGAIGGVINIITKKPDTPQITATLTNGSFVPHAANEVSASMAQTPQPANPMDLLDSQAVTLSVSGGVGELGLIGGGSFTRAANAFTWDDSAVIGAWRRRTNADVLSGSAYSGLSAPLMGGQFFLRGLLDLSDTGAPGQITPPWVSTTARQGETTASATLGWKSEKFLSDAFTFDLKTLYRYDQLSYKDPAISVYSLHRTQTIGIDITQKMTLSDRASVIYGGSGYYDSVDSTNFQSPKDRLNLAAFLSVPVSLSEALTITPAGRYDYFSDHAGSFSYSLSAVFMSSELSALRASVGSDYRAPTLTDLYWYDPSGYVVTDPNLKPETSYSAEVGWSFRSPVVSVDASGFTRLVFNNIVWLTDPVTYITYVRNLTETLFPGVELHATVQVTNTISLEGNYTFLYSFLLNDGTRQLSFADNRRVPYSPVHTARAGIRYTGKLLKVGLEAQYLSDKYTVDSSYAASATLPAYFVADANVSYLLSDHVTLSLSGKNILNALYYTQLGYPMPPFSLEAGMKLTL